VTIWRDVEDALEEIISPYKKANHVISLNQADRNRRKAVKIIGESTGNGLELGSGPGNYSRMVASIHSGPLVCLDFSDKMIRTGKTRNREYDFSYVRGVFESLPFREDVFSLATASYALRDTPDKQKAIDEVSQVMSPGGRFMMVDIGKPDNPVIEWFMSIYMKHIVPVLAGLATGYGLFNNPWSLLYKTYRLLPSNRTLGSMLGKRLERVRVHESVFGAIIVAEARKRCDPV